jgi:UrcA family protein
MYTETNLPHRSSLESAVLKAALIALCAIAPIKVIADTQDHKVVVAIHVSTQGLDLSQPADAQTFYTRLRRAARVACTYGNRVTLVPSDDPGGCAEKALAGAIRSAKVPMLTRIYLNNHTLQDAVALGILVPAQLAAK